MSQVQEIKEKIDIVSFIGEKMSLQRSGKNFRAVCPFHSEKTPSFFVSPELQTFICFGCGKKGDVFTFVQEYDRLTFPEALQALAEKAGVELKQDFDDPLEKQRKMVLEILDLAAQYYNYLLLEHPAGNTGREYVKKRGLQNGTIKNFSIGYAPEGWDHLTKYLVDKKKFSYQDVLATGLVIQGQGGKVYDRFRERLVFPLHDHRGRVVGFSGRVLDPAAKEAKYVNTPETLVYHKRYLLFGYFQNLEAIRDKESVIIMEGEFDVLSSIQAHVKNVVAVKGSALTVEQIRILARTVKTIYLALDADSAGIAATARAIELVQPFPVALRVIPLSGGKDPDELAKTDPAHWREVAEHHVSAFEYILETTAAANDLHTAEGQKTVTNIVLKLLLTVEHAVERTFYFKQLAEKLEISVDVIEQQFESLQRSIQAKQQLPQRASEAPEQKSTEVSIDKRGEYALQIMLRLENPPLPLRSLLRPEFFSVPGHQRLVQAYNEWWQNHDTFLLKPFTSRLPAELQAMVSTLYLEELELAESAYETELALSLAVLKQQHLKQYREKIADDYQKLSEKTDRTAPEDAELQHLEQELKRSTQA